MKLDAPISGLVWCLLFKISVTDIHITSQLVGTCGSYLVSLLLHATNHQPFVHTIMIRMECCCTVKMALTFMLEVVVVVGTSDAYSAINVHMLTACPSGRCVMESLTAHIRMMRCTAPTTPAPTCCAAWEPLTVCLHMKCVTEWWTVTLDMKMSCTAVTAPTAVNVSAMP